MRISFLLAASTAGILALAGIERSAMAQMQPMSPMAEPKAPKATGAPKRKPAGSGYLPRKGGGKGPGQCGTYMYWKGGKCVDSRTGKK